MLIQLNCPEDEVYREWSLAILRCRAGLNYKVIVWGGCDVSISALRAARPVNQARQSGAGSADSVNSEGGPAGPARLSHDNIITPLTFTLHTTSNTMQWIHKNFNHLDL